MTRSACETAASIQTDCPSEARKLLLGPGPDLPVGLEKRHLRHFGPLGHHLAQLSETVRQIAQAAAEDRLPEAVLPFAKQWLTTHEVSGEDGVAPEVSAFLAESEAGARLEGTSEASLSLVAWSLVALPAFRPLFERSLRRAHLNHLLELRPCCWVMDATPLPPGAVLAGVELPSWSDLAALHGSGRAFVLQKGEYRRDLDSETPRSEWEVAIREALAEGGFVCRERFKPRAWWLGHWSSKHGRIELEKLRRVGWQDGRWQVGV